MNIHVREFEQADVDDTAALEQFQKQWGTYQKLVDTNALSHGEVGAILSETLADFSAPFAFLDIACGDAGQMPAALGGSQIRHYHGIDLSAPALALAAKNLEGAAYDVELDHCDFVTALTRRPEPADAAWCGLSIHHLDTAGKQHLLEAIRASTAKFLMIYEPTLADGEDRDGYLARFRRVNQPAWPFMSGEEWRQIEHHVTASDLPETADTWLALGREAGFAQARELFRDPTGFYRVYRYDR